MATSGIAGLSDSFRIAEYDTYFKSHAPPVPPKDLAHEGIRLDKHAKFALGKTRWVYPISTRVEDGATFIEFEAKVEADGTVLHAEVDVSPTLPITARPDVVLFDPDSENRLFLRKVDDEGNALVTRLFLCPFRLDSIAAKQLCSSRFHEGLRRHIPSLWQWTRDPRGSTGKSKDGWFLKQHRHFLQSDAGLERVWVGSDPFAIARRLSDIYVDALAKHQALVEPPPDDNGQVVKRQQRRAFVQMLSGLAESEKTPTKYKQALDIAKLNKEFLADEKQDAELRKRATDGITELIRHLNNPFFSLLQFSSLSKEGFSQAEDEYSEALLEHAETYDYVLRMFDQTAKGSAYLLAVAKEAESNDIHIINQFIFPPSPLAPHAFKTTRWATKSMVSLAKKFYPPMVERLKLGRTKAANRIATAMTHIGIFENLTDAVTKLNLAEVDLGKLKRALGSPTASLKIKTQLFAASTAESIAEFVARDRTFAGKNLSPAKVQHLAFATLDIFNTILAYTAWREAEGENAIVKAGFNLGATAAFTAATMVETVLELTAEKIVSTKLAVRSLSAARAAGGLIYALLDFANGLDAWEENDHDRAIALFTAGAAEAFLASVMLYQTVTGVLALSTPVAIVGFVAAAAYIAALSLKDDPIEIMLRNCEFGQTPYALGAEKHVWSEGPISNWKSDIRKQMRIYGTLMSQFRIHWKRVAGASNPLEVRMTCGFKRPTTEVTLEYFSDAPDGSGVVQAQDTATFVGTKVPTGDNAFHPSLNFIERGAKNILVNARLRDPSLDLDLTLDAVLMIHGEFKDTADKNLVTPG